MANPRPCKVVRESYKFPWSHPRPFLDHGAWTSTWDALCWPEPAVMAVPHRVKERTMAEEATTNGAAMPKKSKKKVAKKTAAKRSSTAKVKFEGSKTDFIRKYANLKPLEVEAKAKEAGLDIPAGYVSSVRSKAKSGKKNVKSAKGKPGPKPKGPLSQHLDHVRALRSVILHVGIDQAKAMMDQIVKDLMVMA